MDRSAAVASLAPVHARALGLLDAGVPAATVAGALGLDLAELTALVRVAEAKVDRIMRERRDEHVAPSAISRFVEPVPTTPHP